MEDNIQEVFALPIGLKKVATMDGENFYGSDRLNQKFIKAMEKNGKIKPISGKISQLINKGDIHPVYYEKGFFKFAAWKIFAPMNQRYTSAFYTAESRRIYMILSNQANLFAMIPNNVLAEVLLHELIHMIANKKNMTFLNIWMPHLINYYRSVYSQIFNIKQDDISDQFLKNIITKLSKAFDGKFRKGQYKNVIMELIKQLMSLSSKSNYDPEIYKRWVQIYVKYGMLVIFDSKIWKSKWRMFTPIIHKLEQGYNKGLGLKSIDVLCGQEVLVPSEVAGVAVMDPKFLKKAHATVKKL